MNTETESFEYRSSSMAKRRTWADVFVSTTYITGGLIFLTILGIGAYFVFGKIPGWFWISIFGSFLFIPFLQERAKDGAELFLIANEPFKLTEYRIGKIKMSVLKLMGLVLVFNLKAEFQELF
jgi:hypothetical protein